MTLYINKITEFKQHKIKIMLTKSTKSTILDKNSSDSSKITQLIVLSHNDIMVCLCGG